MGSVSGLEKDPNTYIHHLADIYLRPLCPVTLVHKTFPVVLSSGSGVGSNLSCGVLSSGSGVESGC